MKKLIHIIGGLAIAVGLLMTPAAPAFAAKSNSEHYKYNGQRAGAILYGLDSSGCVRYELHVDVIQGVIRRTGQRDRTSVLFVDFYGYNNCTWETLPYLFGQINDLPVGSFIIDRQLMSASLVASVDLYDYDNNAYPVQLNLYWSDMGVLEYRASDHYQDVYPNVKIDYFEKRTRRNGYPSGSMIFGNSTIVLAPSFCRGGICGPLENVDIGSLTFSFSSISLVQGIAAVDNNLGPGIVPTLTNLSQNYHLSIESQNISASSYSVDQSGCILSSVIVDATKTNVNANGKKNTALEAEVFLDEYNFCTYEYLLYVSAGSTISESDLVIDQGSGSASLNTTIMNYIDEDNDGDYETAVPIDLNMTWKVEKTTFQRTRDHSHLMSEGHKVNYISDSSFNLAEGSGVISFNGTTTIVNPDNSDGLFISTKQSNF